MEPLLLIDENSLGRDILESRCELNQAAHNPNDTVSSDGMDDQRIVCAVRWTGSCLLYTSPSPRD